MGIHLYNIQNTVQFRIFYYIILPKLLERLRYTRRDVSSLAVVLIFINIGQSLPVDMHIFNGSAFEDFDYLLGTIIAIKLEMLLRDYTKRIVN